MEQQRRLSKEIWWMIPIIPGLITMSAESRFLFHVTDGRMRVWRHKNTAYTPRNIQPTVPYGGGFEYGTGCEWHPSNQTLQCPVVTIRCYPLSAGSWQVFHIVGLCVFSHPIDGCQQRTVRNRLKSEELSQGESLNVHCWQTDIDKHVCHGV
jgi:hypothetical protein